MNKLLTLCFTALGIRSFTKEGDEYKKKSITTPDKIYIGQPNFSHYEVEVGDIDEFRKKYQASSKPLELVEYTKTANVVLEFPPKITRTEIPLP